MWDITTHCNTPYSVQRPYLKLVRGSLPWARKIGAANFVFHPSSDVSTYSVCRRKHLKKCKTNVLSLRRPGPLLLKTATGNVKKTVIYTSVYRVPLLPPLGRQRRVLLRRHRQHAAVPQVLGKRRAAAGRPPAVCLRTCTFVRPVAVATVKIKQQVRLAGHRVVPERGRTLNTGLDDGRVAARPRKGPQNSRRGVVHKHALFALVLHEAQKRLVGGGTGEVHPIGCRERQYGQVDGVARGLVDVRLGLRERLEVGRVSITDACVGRRAGVF